MMKRIAEGATRIFLACGSTDFRKQIPGLVASVTLDFKLDPYNGDYNNLLLWFDTFALIAVVSCGVGIGGELIEENNTKSKDSFENKTTYKKKKWFNSPSGFNKRNSSSAKTK